MTRKGVDTYNQGKAGFSSPAYFVVTPMLDAAVPVLREIYQRFPKGGANLETICQIVTGVSEIDRIHYTGFDVPRTNPIWGSFKRWRQRDAVYADLITVVDVRYAQHLTEDERIFVVSKELCHSFEAVEGTHSVSESAMDDLVAAFSVFSSRPPSVIDLHSFQMELLASIIACEILCPVKHRRELMRAAGEEPDWQALGAQMKIPFPYLQALSANREMDSVEKMLKAFGAID